MCADSGWADRSVLNLSLTLSMVIVGILKRNIQPSSVNYESRNQMTDELLILICTIAEVCLIGCDNAMITL